MKGSSVLANLVTLTTFVFANVGLNSILPESDFTKVGTVAASVVSLVSGISLIALIRTAPVARARRISKRGMAVSAVLAVLLSTVYFSAWHELTFVSPPGSSEFSAVYVAGSPIDKSLVSRDQRSRAVQKVGIGMRHAAGLGVWTESSERNNGAILYALHSLLGASLVSLVVCAVELLRMRRETQHKGRG